MHIYAFGSVCRGDVTPESDVDLLAIVEGDDPRFDAETFSIYSYKRIKEIWAEGNPFAWHLSVESKLLFSSDKSDFLSLLGRPALYRAGRQDCEKFFALFREAVLSMAHQGQTAAFDLSMIFLAVRNFATCFSLANLEVADFSRSAALRLGRFSLDIRPGAYDVLERSRILCTRAVGPPIADDEIAIAKGEFPRIQEWMNSLLSEVNCHAA
jgi:hypothetical protein